MRVRVHHDEGITHQGLAIPHRQNIENVGQIIGEVAFKIRIEGNLILKIGNLFVVPSKERKALLRNLTESLPRKLKRRVARGCSWLVQLQCELHLRSPMFSLAIWSNHRKHEGSSGTAPDAASCRPSRYQGL